MSRKRVIHFSIIVGVALCILAYVQIAYSYDGCTVCWYLTRRDNSIEDPENRNCDYICLHKLGECIKYEHPDCPGCAILVCYYANGIQEYWRYRCKMGLNANCNDCSDEITCGTAATMACDGMAGPYADYLATISSNWNLACSCGPIEECANCSYPWPEDLKQQIAEDMTSWEAGSSVIQKQYRWFKCNCDTGKCTEFPPQGGTH